MKEASGEANLTVVTIILIGVVVAIATPLITSMMSSTAKRTCCQNYGGIWKNSKCYSVNVNGNTTGAVITENQYWDNTKNACK